MVGASDYPIWAYYAHGRQRRYQEDPVSLPSGRLEKTTRSSPHHVAQHRPTGSETTPPYAPWSSRFGSELPSVEDDVGIWCYAMLRVACQKRRRRPMWHHICGYHSSCHHKAASLFSQQEIILLDDRGIGMWMTFPELPHESQWPRPPHHDWVWHHSHYAIPTHIWQNGQVNAYRRSTIKYC